MNTTLQQIHLNGEVIDLTEFAKEQTLVQKSDELKEALTGLDLTSLLDQFDADMAGQLQTIIGYGKTT